MFALSVAALAAAAHAQSLNVVNKCTEDVFLLTQTSFGTVDTNVIATAGATVNLGISTNWDGAVSTGTGCSSDGSTCATGGPTWDGVTPYSRAEFNFVRILAFLGWKMYLNSSILVCNPRRGYI